MLHKAMRVTFYLNLPSYVRVEKVKTHPGNFRVPVRATHGYPPQAAPANDVYDSIKSSGRHSNAEGRCARKTLHALNRRCLLGTQEAEQPILGFRQTLVKMLSMAAEAEAEAVNSTAEAAAAATVTPASPKAEAYEQKEEEEEDEEEEDGDDEEVWSSSDSEIGDALDWLDSRGGPTGGPDAYAAFSLASRRPNAHGGLLSRPLQPISNRTQKISSHIRAAPLEVGVFSPYLMRMRNSSLQPKPDDRPIRPNSIISLS